MTFILKLAAGSSCHIIAQTERYEVLITSQLRYTVRAASQHSSPSCSHVTADRPDCQIYSQLFFSCIFTGNYAVAGILTTTFIAGNLLQFKVFFLFYDQYNKIY